MISSDRISLTPVPIPFPRGVHSYIEGPTGQLVYIAITSTGALLNGEIRHRLEGETDAMIRIEMWADLDKQDTVDDTPSYPPRLGLYVDGERRL